MNSFQLLKLPVLYRFRDMLRFEIRIFDTVCPIFNATTEGASVKIFEMTFATKKTSWWAYEVVEKFDDAAVLTQYPRVTDGWTDRLTEILQLLRALVYADACKKIRYNGNY